jgi:translation elongation factor EF-1alpha
MAEERPEHPEHPESDAIGRVTHYYSHLAVAAVTLEAPLRVGDRIHVKGHTTDLVQAVDSLQVDHKPVERAVPGDDVALKVDDHVREHDQIYLEE